MTKLDEKRAELEAKQKALHTIFEEMGEDLDATKVTSIKGDSRAIAAEIKKLNDELTAIGQEVEELQAVAKAGDNVKKIGEYLNAPVSPMVHPSAGAGKAAEPPKSIGELFIDSKAFKEFEGHHGPTAELGIEVKTLFQTSAGWAPETTRTGRVVDYAVAPIQVLDRIPQTTTGQAAVVYMEETTRTNAAVEVAEGGAYPDSAFVLAEKSSTVRKVATFLPVTDEQMEDVSQVEGYVNNRLTTMLRERLETQVLVGDGVAPNLMGLTHVVGVQSQALGADPVPDAIYKAMTLIRVTGVANPNLVIMHPNDWQGVRLLRTADGIYIWGSPADAGPDRIWGLPVAQASRLTENTGLVGDFTFCEIAARRGIEVQVSNSHDDYFIKGKQAIRADVRVAFPIYRPTAFCLVTGI
jgi:HK97 family phage major capsid protein